MCLDVESIIYTHLESLSALVKKDFMNHGIKNKKVIDGIFFNMTKNRCICSKNCDTVCYRLTENYLVYLNSSLHNIFKDINYLNLVFIVDINFNINCVLYNKSIVYCDSSIRKVSIENKHILISGDSFEYIISF